MEDAFDELFDVEALLGLSDLAFLEALHTWSNSNVGPHRVSEKLDRVLVNDRWLEDFPSSRAHFDSPGISDHSPGRVFIHEMPKRRIAPFRFRNAWAFEEDF